MAKQTINIGATANDGTGDQLRSAFDKANQNFTELYDKLDAAWVDWTPVVTAGGGGPPTYTASGRYKRNGKTVHFQCAINITALNGANSGMNVTMPGGLLAANNFAALAVEVNVDGSMGAARIAAASPTMAIWKYNNTTYFIANAVVYCSGTYETQ